MDVLAAFLVGYLLGTRQGREGFERVISSLRVIAESNVAKELSGAVLALASERIGQRSWLLGLLGDMAKDAVMRLLSTRR